MKAKGMEQVITKDYVFNKMMPLLNDAFGDMAYTIAGGCPRDLYYDVPVKDIDVYVNYDALPYTVVDKLNVIGSLSSTTTAVADVEYHARVYNLVGTPVQIILKRLGSHETFVQDLLSSFDFGCCRIALDQNKEFIFTNDFLIDHNNETITLCYQSDETIVNSLTNHFDRIKIKYPNRTLKVTPIARETQLLTEAEVR